MLTRRKLLAVAVIALLASSTLAGCMEDGPGVGGGGAADLTSDEARNEFQDAMRSVQSGTADVASKVAINMTLTTETDNGTQEGFLSMYVDADLDEVIFKMAGNAFDSQDSSTQISEIVMAQMGKTIFLGDGSELIGFYNQSAEPVDGFHDLENGSVGDTIDQGSGSSEPLGFLDVIAGNHSDNLEGFTAEEITYQGKDALEIKSADAGSEDKPYLRAVIELEPRRPLLVEGRVTQESVDEDSGFEEPGEFEMTFRYGDDASHPMRDPLVRLETMTFATDEDTGGMQQNPGRWTNKTVQPSRDLPEGEVALDEVTATVTNSSFGGDDQVVLTMGLEEGSASADEAELTYEDVDGDGMVSEGDELQLERLDENASLSLTLEDETTGLKLSPSAGALAALAAVGAAAALVRVRPD